MDRNKFGLEISTNVLADLSSLMVCAKTRIRPFQEGSVVTET